MSEPEYVEPEVIRAEPARPTVCTECEHFHQGFHKLTYYKPQCKATAKIHPVTGQMYAVKYCSDVNTDGRCPKFEPKKSSAEGGCCGCIVVIVIAFIVIGALCGGC
jgi:hypothetical protein